MKLLVDMNLSPGWVAILTEAGWETEHWSKIGDHRARDSDIMAWAKQHGYIVFTHDLDFGSLFCR
jgi:predicted nuclease of predicted toxin-antitoxin system